MEPVSGRRPLLVVLAFAAGLLSPVPAVAADEEEVRVTLVAILATERDDARLCRG